MTDEATERTARRTFLRVAGAASVATTGIGTAAATGAGDDETDGGTADGSVEEGAGLVTVERTTAFAETVDCIESAIEDQEPLTLLATVDHAENAASVGEDLPPTKLLIFGNPALGTELMQRERSVGVDLPQKLLVWAAEDGGVNVTYNDPEYLAARHGIEGGDETFETIADALANLARAGE